MHRAKCFSPSTAIQQYTAKNVADYNKTWIMAITERYYYVFYSFCLGFNTFYEFTHTDVYPSK